MGIEYPSLLFWNKFPLSNHLRFCSLAFGKFTSFKSSLVQINYFCSLHFFTVHWNLSEPLERSLESLNSYPEPLEP